jgi:erythromycin esterase-like protein
MASCACSQCARPAVGPAFCSVHAACACADLECAAHAGADAARSRAVAVKLAEVTRDLRRARAELDAQGSEGPTAAELIGAWSVEVCRQGGGRAWYLQRSEGEARELYAKAHASAETRACVLRNAGGARVEEWDR